MSWVADTHNNPFLVDDETSPPQRSAFAILMAERDDLDSLTVEELLERAKKRLSEDPQLATVYGRPLSEGDLEKAATRLTNPADRLINELLDFKFHRFDLSSITELTNAIEAFRGALSTWEWPEIVDLSLLAMILSEDLEPLTPEPLGRDVPKAPELPVLKDMIQRLSAF